MVFGKKKKKRLNHFIIFDIILMRRLVLFQDIILDNIINKINIYILRNNIIDYFTRIIIYFKNKKMFNELFTL